MKRYHYRAALYRIKILNEILYLVKSLQVRRNYVEFLQKKIAENSAELSA